MTAEFITDVAATFDVGAGVTYRAHFDVKRYSDELFESFGIPFPTMLIHAVAKRRSEYLAGRYLAKLALEKFAVLGFDVSADENRCPIWPPSLVGSISHTDSVALCAVAHRSAFSALGIDVENWISDGKQSDLEGQIANWVEIDQLRELGLSRECCLTMVFSAKESIFKALYPWARRYFDFTAARLVSVDRPARQMVFMITESLGSLVGRGLLLKVDYRLSAETVITCASLPEAALDTCRDVATAS